MVVTVVLSGVPQYVMLEDLSQGLKKCLKSDNFAIRELSNHSSTGQRYIALDFKTGDDAKIAQQTLNGYEYKLPNDKEYTLKARVTKNPDLMPKMPHSNIDDRLTTSSSPVYSKAVMAHDSQRAAVDKRNESVNDELLRLQKLQILAEKQSKLAKAEKKMKKAKKKRKKHSESDASEPLSDERRKRKKNKKKRAPSPASSDSSPPAAYKQRGTSLKRPRSCSESSCSSSERKQRRRLIDTALLVERSPLRKRSPKATKLRSARSPVTHHSRHSPMDTYAYSRTDPDHYGRYPTHAEYYQYGKRGETTSNVVFVDREPRAYRAPSTATVTEIDDEPDHRPKADKPTDDVEELEEGEVDDDDELSDERQSTMTWTNVPKTTNPERGRDRRSPESRKRNKKMPLPIEEERYLSEDDIRQTVPRPIKQESDDYDSGIRVEEYEEIIRPPKRISPNPKFVIPVNKILREMRFHTKLVEEDIKDKFVGILCVILRQRMKHMLVGKDYMNSKSIVELYREHYNSEQDGELVASVVNAMKDGGFQDFVPSDDEDEPKKEGPEDLSEFLVYVTSKKKDDENKENEAKKNCADDDVIILEKNVDVIVITDAEEAQNKKLLEMKRSEKDVTEAPDLNNQKEISQTAEPAPYQENKEEVKNYIMKMSNEKAIRQSTVILIDVTDTPDIEPETVKTSDNIKKEKAEETVCVKSEHIKIKKEPTDTGVSETLDRESETARTSDAIKERICDTSLVSQAKETVRVKSEEVNINVKKEPTEIDEPGLPKTAGTCNNVQKIICDTSLVSHAEKTVQSKTVREDENIEIKKEPIEIDQIATLDKGSETDKNNVEKPIESDKETVCVRSVREEEEKTTNENSGPSTELVKPGKVEPEETVE